MIGRRLLPTALCLAMFVPHAASALDWEIERNFRYFLYPSDVAMQRVARDIAIHRKGTSPGPQEIEALINGGGFWSLKLAEAGDLRKSWPVDWPRDNDATTDQLLAQLRAAEGRPAPVREPELDRRGWASLLVRERSPRRPGEATLTGSTATCWDPVQRLHSGCSVWGDYVRPPGWIVRVFDPAAPAGQSCQWSMAGAVVAGPGPAQFLAATRRALTAQETTVTADCRELRIVVPSDPSEPKAVAAVGPGPTITRTSPDGAAATVTVRPQDRLIIGFGDSFTSGEGNPERPALFTGVAWQGGNLPARAPDPVSKTAADTRAQWTDRWCHRSVYSWQIRTALGAALADPHQSFTVLPYGCSGAEITEGILYEYEGVEWSKATDTGVIGSRSEMGLAYQELCKPEAFRSYCASGHPWCGRTEAPTAAEEQAPGFYSAAPSRLRHALLRCGPELDQAGSTTTASVFKRAADALLLDIGINDVGFSGWAEAIILQDPFLRKTAGAAAPCFDGTANCAPTRALFNRLDNRYRLLRTVLDQYLLPDFGIDPRRADDPSHVIVAVYPPALQDETGRLCPQGNGGLTIATFPSLLESGCDGSALPVARGVLAAWPASDQVERDVDQARRTLNERLAAFARQAPSFAVVGTPDDPKAYTSRYANRGVCATTDPQSHPPAGKRCFTAQDFASLRCELNPESMHVPRAEAGGCVSDPAEFLPFSPVQYPPYRSRTRLFRTMNDVFLAINQRQSQYLDQGPSGLLDLSGRATGGAFHPTAEGHAIIADETASELCDRLGCGR